MGAGGALPYDALLARIGRASFRVIRYRTPAQHGGNET